MIRSAIIWKNDGYKLKHLLISTKLISQNSNAKKQISLIPFTYGAKFQKTNY
jgi:hypothetical protein